LGYDIHFLALGGELTWNANDGGVGDDEITGGREALLIWYSKPIMVSTFELVDLFNEGPDNNSYRDAGFYGFDSDFSSGLSLDGFGSFEADLWQSIGGEGPDAGSYTVGINNQVQGIAFFAALNAVNDYAVAGYTTPVPEPSTVLLLGLGLVGLAGFGRKKFKK
jgi:PEP-CTERM motif